MFGNAVSRVHHIYPSALSLLCSRYLQHFFLALLEFSVSKCAALTPPWGARFAVVAWLPCGLARSEEARNTAVVLMLVLEQIGRVS